MPQISVIVPVYKVEPYLRRCADSILTQSFSDFELILVDDGSPDSCPAICDSYAALDPRVHVIHQKNGGLSAARNAGIDWAFAHSDSRWLTFIDSDDWVHMQFLEVLYQSALQKQTDISMCRHKKQSAYTPDEPYDWQNYVTVAAPGKVYLHPSGIGVEAFAWGRLYRKSLFQNIRYPIGKIWEDIYTTYKLLFQVPAIAVAELPLYLYFMNDSSIIHTNWKPSHWDIIDAYRQNLAYFADTQDKSFYRSIEKGYIAAIYGEFLLLKENQDHPDYAAYQKKTRCEMKLALSKYAKELNYSFGTHSWYYEAAYPHLVPVYHKIYTFLLSAAHACKKIFRNR